LQDPAKFTQIGIFGLKTNHLATLVLDAKTTALCCHAPTLAMHCSIASAN
jgi:hypothetical protein